MDINIFYDLNCMYRSLISSLIFSSVMSIQLYSVRILRALSTSYMFLLFYYAVNWSSIDTDLYRSN